MDKHHIEEIINIVAQQSGVPKDHIKVESRLVDDLGMDSLDVVEVVMAVEEEFDIQLDDEYLYGLGTVQDIINQVERLTHDR